LLVNARIRSLGETVLRVKDLERTKRFYVEVVGLDILQEFPGIAFLEVAAGYGGHTQIVGLFQEALPVPFPEDHRGEVSVAHSSLHHFAVEIAKEDYEPELQRLRGLGVELTTFVHQWCRWRSIYIRDPEGNILEYVCYDETIDKELGGR
jgi:catechol 2,3-dioxygenase-like lactoylglutathione lyase family enzyme